MRKWFDEDAIDGKNRKNPKKNAIHPSPTAAEVSGRESQKE
jgi:hypothetical protein